METRFVECRAAVQGMKIGGYAATYGTMAKLPEFRERIASRAFDSVLATNPDCVALINHDPNKPLGRTKNGTLRLRGDDKGLAFEVDLPNTSYANDLHESVKRGDINGCSFGFQLRSEDQDWDEEDVEDEDGKRSKQVVRTIRRFNKLKDVSIVTYPAYGGTNAEARNQVGVETRSAFEGFMRQRDHRTEVLRTLNRSQDFAKRANEEISFGLRLDFIEGYLGTLDFIHGVASPEDRRRRRLLLDL